MFGGPPVGSPFGLPGGSTASAAAGLPFAGVPVELRKQAEAILADEPTHPDPKLRFEPVDYDRRPFTLRRFLRPHRAALAVALVLVVIETLALQAGPLLTQRGIDEGVAKGDKGLLVAVAVLYVAAVAVST